MDHLCEMTSIISKEVSNVKRTKVLYFLKVTGNLHLLNKGSMTEYHVILITKLCIVMAL